MSASKGRSVQIVQMACRNSTLRRRLRRAVKRSERDQFASELRRETQREYHEDVCEAEAFWQAEADNERELQRRFYEYKYLEPDDDPYGWYFDNLND